MASAFLACWSPGRANPHVRLRLTPVGHGHKMQAMLLGKCRTGANMKLLSPRDDRRRAPSLDKLVLTLIRL